MPRVVEWVQQEKQVAVAVEVADGAEILAVEFQQVEGMEGFADGLAVDEEVSGDGGGGPGDGGGQFDDEAAAVDAGDALAELGDHDAAAVVFFLEAMGVVGEQAAQLAAVGGVEQLAADSGVLAGGGMRSARGQMRQGAVAVPDGAALAGIGPLEWWLRSVDMAA